MKFYTISTENAKTPKSSNPETQIPPYLSVQIQIEIMI